MPSEPPRCSQCTADIVVVDVRIPVATPRRRAADYYSVVSFPGGAVSCCPRLGCVGFAWTPLSGR